MARRRRPPSQGWRTFLLNHADGIASIDLFVVPTISFKLLYGLLILRHDRRRILWLGVTAHPTAEWIARQVSEAERLCRTTDRLDQTRMLGSCDRVWRAASASRAGLVSAILQRHANASFTRQGLTRSTIGPGGRKHSPATSPRRIAPSLRSDMICDRDNVRTGQAIGECGDA